MALRVVVGEADDGVSMRGKNVEEFLCVAAGAVDHDALACERGEEGVEGCRGVRRRGGIRVDGCEFGGGEVDCGSVRCLKDGVLEGIDAVVEGVSVEDGLMCRGGECGACGVVGCRG